MRILFGAALFCCALGSGCASKSVSFVHPQTGARAKCAASGFGFMSVVVGSTVDECVRRIEKEGFVPVEKLTPQERADLEARGLLPKE
ncbi:MAG TPA: hypothetical protein VNL14_01425 [Candidatus Acidoferrales bacterium]|nr:hypothetical protein [Candidatus Acidoferrales bacterium]